MCYLRDKIPDISIFEELVKCDLIKNPPKELCNNFANMYRDNDNIILYPSCHEVYGDPIVSIRLLLNQKYINLTTEGKGYTSGLLLTHKELPKGLNYISQKYINIKASGS